jgi:hypothetical protein
MSTKTKSKKPKAKAGAWFMPTRGSYLPASPEGWLTYLPFVAYLLFALIVGLRDTTSWGIAILFIVPNWVAASVIMTYIAARKS